MLDNFEGEPQIVELQQTAGDIDRNTKANIFRGAINPVAGLKQIIELEGAHAKVQSHADVPSLYINFDSAPEQAQKTMMPHDRFRIVRAEVRGNKRILGDMKRQITGKTSQEQHLVKTTSTRVSGGWLKLTPTETLAPGEYVLVEMVSLEGTGKEGMNLDVWDFGVNPKAPANANPWKPDVKPATPPAGTNN
jgi:hypothetical protein